MEEDRRPAWSWPELVACFLLGMLMPALAFQLLHSAGFYAAVYGPERVAELKPQSPDQTRFLLWAQAAAFPLQIAGVLALLAYTSGAKAADVGLPGKRLGRQTVTALAVAAALIPAVYGVSALKLAAANRLGVPQTEHHFTRLGQAGLGPGEWALLVFVAVVVAPVWEELFFRGLVQPAVIAEGREGQLAALMIAVAWAAAAGWVPAGAALAASLACVLLPGGWRGVYAVAVLFAAVHSAAWPSPIPLLPLGAGLGWLARGGLLGPIVLHALFNAVACALLLAAPLV
ncbi:MAG: CPBP family glutamic-type intramembrane protease [Gemmataceae bacterium]